MFVLAGLLLNLFALDILVLLYVLEVLALVCVLGILVICRVLEVLVILCVREVLVLLCALQQICKELSVKISISCPKIISVASTTDMWKGVCKKHHLLYQDHLVLL